MNEKSFKLNIFLSDWDVHFKEELDGGDPEMHYKGLCHSVLRTMQVCTKKVDGSPVSNKDLRETLIHECIHAILDEGGYPEASEVEPMVALLAKSLNHIIDDIIGETK